MSKFHNIDTVLKSYNNNAAVLIERNPISIAYTAKIVDREAPSVALFAWNRKDNGAEVDPLIGTGKSFIHALEELDKSCFFDDSVA